MLECNKTLKLGITKADFYLLHPISFSGIPPRDRRGLKLFDGMVMFLEWDSSARINRHRSKRVSAGAVSTIVCRVGFCRDRLRVDFEQILVGVVDDVAVVDIVGVVDEAAVVLKNVQFEWRDW